MYQPTTRVKGYHKPSGIEVEIDRYRSQHKNKDEALNIIRDMVTEFKAGDIIVKRDGIARGKICCRDFHEEMM